MRNPRDMAAEGAYPFTPEKQIYLRKFRREWKNQTLESILVQGDLDYVVRTNGAKVRVRDLVGKAVLIYFSDHRSEDCRKLTPFLAVVYHELKLQGKPVEVVFVSCDEDQDSYSDYFGSMPWLALPSSDPRTEPLRRWFKVRYVPALVALEPSGKTATMDARLLVEDYGAEAFPFTEEHVRELQAQTVAELEAEGDNYASYSEPDWMREALAQQWPERVKIGDHEHELVKTKRRGFVCYEGGEGWAFYCHECDFDAHRNCSLESVSSAALE